MEAILYPRRLYSRAAVLSRPSPVPVAPGVYAWFFKEIPPAVPVDGCVVHNDLTLLYVGIAPTYRTDTPSKATLRSRLRQHMASNAEGSTLRLSLGCLLRKRLRLQLRRVGGGKRMTFGQEGEERLSGWLEANAFVAWVVHPTPWEVERELIASMSLPLNLNRNAGHGFAAQLAEMRSQARTQARELSIA